MFMGGAWEMVGKRPILDVRFAVVLEAQIMGMGGAALSCQFKNG
jgi:hypothetical protein